MVQEKEKRKKTDKRWFNAVWSGNNVGYFKNKIGNSKGDKDRSSHNRGSAQGKFYVLKDVGIFLTLGSEQGGEYTNIGHVVVALLR